MTDEPRYTLNEARVKLDEQECMEHGHSWEVIMGIGWRPIRLICTRCGDGYGIVQPEGKR